MQHLAIPGCPFLRRMGGLDIHRCMEYANDQEHFRYGFRGAVWVDAFRTYAAHLGYFRSCKAVCRCGGPHWPECDLVILHDPEGQLNDWEDLALTDVGAEAWPHSDTHSPSRPVLSEVLGMPAPIAEGTEYHPGEVVESDPDTIHTNTGGND